MPVEPVEQRAKRMTLDPIHQFNINNLFTIGHIGGQTIAFTNSSAYMLLTVAVICLLAVRGFKGRELVPGRFQSAAELSLAAPPGKGTILF